MKILLGTILFVSLILLGVYITKSYREEHRLARTVGRVLIMTFIIVLVNMGTLFAPSERMCLIAYSIYFVATDWMLYYLFKFSTEYIGNVFEDFVKKSLMIFLLVADNIGLICNIFFGHLFGLKHVRVADADFYELETTSLFMIHFFIVLLLIFFCLITLYYRTFTSAAFYRKKYLLIAIILTILGVFHIQTLTSAIDVSIAGYIAEGICIYYCALVYTPQRLLPTTLAAVAEELSIGILVLDIEGKKIYKNRYARMLFDESEMLVDSQGEVLEKWCCDQYLKYAEEFSMERRYYRGGEERVLKIQLQRLVDERNQLQGGYYEIQDRTDEINKLKMERYQATHDSLTGLYNKTYFYEQAERYIKKHPDEELLMVCTDIKDFKMINDFFGMDIGDTILINFSKSIQEEKNGAVVYGRLGNDIFAMLIPKDKYREDLLVQEARDAFASCMNKSVMFPTINYIGVYEVKERDILVSMMCDRARLAITSIKGDYHTLVAYYDDALRDNILYEQELISQLQIAIQEGQLQMYLQPQMAADGKMLGAEALVRWMHPVKGQIMPGDFIPVFERNGLISDVDLFVWETACQQLRKWKDEGREDLYISVNISPKDFFFLDIHSIFMNLIEKYDIDPKTIKLEITETAIVMDFNRQLDLITRLRRNGFIVEMDDFGSGYSSLNMLKDIHVDVLKIDMAFLKKAKDEIRSRKILQMIISLSNQLGMPVITEGVETAEQVEFLTEMGCGMFQGYYFAKPMPVGEFESRYLA